jgi:hypothetical protein
MGAGIPSYLVSMTAPYAEQLLDPALAAQTLLPRQLGLGLGREHVYYRRPRNDGRIAAGSRILWYVTQAPNNPRGSLRAISTVAEVSIAPVNLLYRRFARLGVYTHKQVLSAADENGQVMAIRFVDTETFADPPDLDELREMCVHAGGRFDPPLSPRLIGERMFRLLYGRCSGYGR